VAVKSRANEKVGGRLIPTGPLLRLYRINGVTRTYQPLGTDAGVFQHTSGIDKAKEFGYMVEVRNRPAIDPYSTATNNEC